MLMVLTLEFEKKRINCKLWICQATRNLTGTPLKMPFDNIKKNPLENEKMPKQVVVRLVKFRFFSALMLVS